MFYLRKEEIVNRTNSLKYDQLLKYHNVIQKLEFYISEMNDKMFVDIFNKNNLSGKVDICPRLIVQAAQTGNYPICKFLLEEGFDVNYSDVRVLI